MQPLWRTVWWCLKKLELPSRNPTPGICQGKSIVQKDTCTLCSWASLVVQIIKNLSAMQETWVRSLGWEDPLEKRKNTGYPLQYSGLENSMDRGAWQVTVHGVTNNRTRLSDFHYVHGSTINNSPGEGNGTPLQYSCLENPWMEEPGRLQSMGSQRVGPD